MDLAVLSQRSRQVIGAIVPDCEQREQAFTVVRGGIDPAMLVPFIGYIQGVREEFSQYRHNGDTGACARLMHSVKGVGGAVGFPELSVLGAVAEDLAKLGDREGLVKVDLVLDQWLAVMQSVTKEQA
ncbi:MAG TPA: Hpt domain-containing protein [Kiritimatiellia bacterium]|nr:Hpt domain-containing protein [Kiritimatiellia bacterium]HMP34836.1 Hpt domain-containing protein [Kiritimatiellia bacterium]